MQGTVFPILEMIKKKLILKNDITNDYEFPKETTELGKHHFKISYEKKINEYLLKDLGDGNGTFYKIKDRVVSYTFI